MGIHGFGQVNSLELQRLLAAKGIQGGQRPATAGQQNVDMTRDGSIFNVATPNSVNRRGFNEQNADNAIRPQPKTSQQQTQSQDISVAGGTSAARSAKGQAAAAKEGTAQTEQNTKIVNQLTSQSQQLSKTTKKDEKEMEKTLKTNQRLVEQNNTRLLQLTNEVWKESLAIDALNTELEFLVAQQEAQQYSMAPPGADGTTTSSSSMTSPSIAGGGAGVSDKIASISSQVGARSARITRYTGNIGRIQVRNNSYIRTMNRTSRIYQRTVAKNQKTMEAAQTKTDKVMEVANKVGEISIYTTLAGQGVQLIGKGMRALGEMMLGTVWGAAAGAALISASVPVEATGVTVETVGNYGSMASSVTLSACCVANGDYQGAFQNLAMAAATATAAVQGTQQMASGFSGIKEQATQAMQEGLEKQAAKQLANQNMDTMKAEGFSKKEIKAMAKEQTAGSLEGKTMDQLKAEVKGAKFDAQGNRIKMSDRAPGELVQGSINNGQVGMTSNLNQVQNAKMEFINNNEVIQQQVQQARTEAENAARAAGKSAEEIAQAGNEAANAVKQEASQMLGTKAGRKAFGKATNKAAKSAVANAKNKVLGKSTQTTAATAGKKAISSNATNPTKASQTDYKAISQKLEKAAQSLQMMAAMFPSSMNGPYGTYGAFNNYYTGNPVQNWDKLYYIQANRRMI